MKQEKQEEQEIDVTRVVHEDSRMRIRFATSAALPGLADDDRLAVDALRERGHSVEPLVWTEPEVANGDVVVIRSCWDYHLHEAAFRNWIDDLDARGVTVINSPALIRWNMHKSYIGDLENRGVTVVPTVRSGSGDTRALRDIVNAAGWSEAVVKPAVSASAWETWRVAAADLCVDRDTRGSASDNARGANDSHEVRFDRLRSRGDVLVQRYLPEIATDGEWSLMFFGTDFSHAVRKRPKSGDFRVQIDHGGTAARDSPSQDIIDAGTRVVCALPYPSVYCRVDGVVADDAFLLMEAECIDPVLFLAQDAAAPMRFAEQIIECAVESAAAGP